MTLQTVLAASPWTEQQWYLDYFTNRLSIVNGLYFPVALVVVFVLTGLTAIISICYWLADAYLTNMKMLQDKEQPKQ